MFLPVKPDNSAGRENECPSVTTVGAACVPQLTGAGLTTEGSHYINMSMQDTGP